MKDEILSHLNEPKQLERIYRSNKQPFKQEFNSLYPQLKGNTIADFWNERLNYEEDEIYWGNRGEWLLLLIAALVAGLIAKLPAIFNINEEFFYPRNIGFIFLPLLTAYFAWKNKLQPKLIAVIGGIMLLSVIYINLLPASNKSDTLMLACIHLPLLLWVVLGAAFTGNDLLDYNRRLDYLKFNGDLVVMTTLIVIAGGIMSGITIGLFSLIGLKIEKFYFENIVVFGLPAAPILGTWLVRSNPQLVSKVSPVIARIFSPLVLVMLVIYLAAMVLSGKDPYNDREFLLIFNVLLVGVMALIFFSVSESTKSSKSRSETWVLLLLSTVTIIVNGIALSAILFRISEWGMTPNRAAVLGSNVLILVNLLLVLAQLIKVVSRKSEIEGVGRIISSYLPIYFAWTIIVTFIFPVLFGFK
ncbi:MAG: hypothetical protein ACM3VS_18555 [Candidatus Dadabacteria bacterium]